MRRMDHKISLFTNSKNTKNSKLSQFSYNISAMNVSDKTSFKRRMISKIFKNDLKPRNVFECCFSLNT